VALAAFSFLATGSASAQTANSSTTNAVQIIENSQGQAVFSQSAITVKSGTQVTIVNHTAVRQFVFNTLVFVRLASGASVSITPQFTPERLKIYESSTSSLLITISPGP
jgi:hypothetical protein